MDSGEKRAWGNPSMPTERRILFDFGYFGHFLHMHGGGRSGKQHILTELLLKGGQLTQRELLESSGVSGAALSEVLGKLEAEGLVERSRSEEDRRQLEVQLTPEGAYKAKETEARKNQFEAEAVSMLTKPEQEQLLAMLDRIAAGWRQIEERERKMGCQQNSSNAR